MKSNLAKQTGSMKTEIRPRRTSAAVVGALVVLLTLASSIPAQSIKLEGGTIGGGVSSGGRYSVSGSAGGQASGAMSGSRYSVQGGAWSVYVAVQTPGAPLLSIKRVGSMVEISWPLAGASGFVVERSAAVGGGAGWSEVATTVNDADGVRKVTLALQSGRHFFRLKQTSEK